MSSTAAAARSRAEARARNLPAAPAVALLVGIPLGALLWRSGEVPLMVALGALAAMAFVVFSSGSLLLRAARADALPASAAWVLGVVATSLAVYGLVATLRLNAASAFLAWAAATLGAQALLPRSLPARLDRAQIVAFVLCAAATAFWCGDLAKVAQHLSRDGELATWVDQFIHGTVIAQFGDPRSGGRSMELAGMPSPPYHYASYVLPAIFAWPLDLSGLTLATAVWVPLGFFTLCAAAYTLGDALAGRPGGFAALGALTLLPDAASYGLYNRLFGYYWYVIAVPTASYGVALALLSFAFLKRWRAGRDPRALIVSAGLVAGSALIRVHVFALLFPAWLVCAALCTDLVKRRWLGFFGGALAAFGLAVWSFYRLFPDSAHALELFLAVTHNDQQPVSYRGLYAGLMALYGSPVAVPVGVVLVLAATVGVFGVLYPISVWLLRRVRALDAIDAAPLALLGCDLLLMLTAPVPAHGDATEFTQRPFVLVYAAFAVWTAAGLARWVAQHGQITQRRVWLPLLVAAAAATVWILESTVRDWRWGYAYRVAEGLPQAASFVRARSHAGDVLAAAGLQPQLVTTDVAVQLAALTGVPAYLARPFMPISNGGPRGEAALRRYIALRAVGRAPDEEAARRSLQALGIRWYVVANRDRRGPSWDPERRKAAFVDRMVAVYALD